MGRKILRGSTDGLPHCGCGSLALAGVVYASKSNWRVADDVSSADILGIMPRFWSTSRGLEWSFAGADVIRNFHLYAKIFELDRKLLTFSSHLVASINHHSEQLIDDDSHGFPELEQVPATPPVERFFLGWEQAGWTHDFLFFIVILFNDLTDGKLGKQ